METAPEQAKKYRIKKSQLDVIEFEGRLISEATTEHPSNPRWTEIKIYKTLGGRYIVQRIGKSVVYHLSGSTCNFGIPTLGSDLPEDSEPCSDCHPPVVHPWDGTPASKTDLAQTYNLETSRYSADDCDGASLPHLLTHRKLNRATGKEESFMSSVSLRALQSALTADPDLAPAVLSVQRIQ